MLNKTLIFRCLKILLISLLYGFSLYPYAQFWMLLIGISIFLGFTTYLGVSVVIDTFQNRRDARLVKAALAGERGGNGKSRAVLGKIYSLDVSITAPFSRRECPIVSYDIYQQYWKRNVSHNNNSSTLSEPIICSGYHLAPSEIRTGIERVKILGFPELSDVPEDETTSYGRTESIMKQTDFTQPKGFIEGVNELSKAIQVDENGAAAEDFRFRKPVPGQSLKSREQAIKKGSDICLIGIFDAARDAIVPDKRLFGRTMKLIPGTGKQVLSKLTKDSGIVVAFGIVVALLCISIGLLPYASDSLLMRIPAGDKLVQYRKKTLARNAMFTRQETISKEMAQKRQQEEEMKRERQNEQATSKEETLNMTLLLIQNGDVEQFRKELNQGLDPDTHIPSGNGYSLPFIEAINYNQLEIARILLESGADINAVNSYMVNGLDAAISSRNTEAVRLVLGAGTEAVKLALAVGMENYPGDAHRLSPVNRAILNQDAEVLTLLLEAGADPSPPGHEQYLEALPADSEKADKIHKLLDRARENKQ